MMLARAAATRALCGVRVSGAATSRWLSQAKSETEASETTAEADSEGESAQGAAEEINFDALLKEKDDKIAELTDQFNDMKSRYVGSLADMENLRKRSATETSNAKDFGIQKFSKDMLTVADTMELALENAPRDEIDAGNNPSAAAMLEGMEGINRNLHKVFERHNLSQIRPEIGDVFDPNMMEAQLQVPKPDAEPNTIAMVMRTGYSLKGRVLRAATVGVVQQ